MVDSIRRSGGTKERDADALKVKLDHSTTGAPNPSEPTDYAKPERKGFNALPVELRLKIWRYTFPPGQHHDLTQWSRRVTQRPVALGINYESRQETLKHYHIIYVGERSKACMTASCPWILIVNPSRDSLCVSLRTVSKFTPQLELLNEQIPGGVKQLRGLEIISASWYDIEFETWRISDPETRPYLGRREEMLDWADQSSNLRSLPTLLKYFDGIPKIRLTMFRGWQSGCSHKSSSWERHPDRLRLVPAVRGLYPLDWVPVSPSISKDAFLRKIFRLETHSNEGKSTTITLRPDQFPGTDTASAFETQHPKDYSRVPGIEFF